VQKHIDNVEEFMRLASQDFPHQLTIPDEKTRQLRAKLILEEAFELIEKGLGVEVSMPAGADYLDIERFEYNCISEPDPVEAMDGAVDSLWVTTTGVAAIFGLADKLEECIAEVDRSNLSKFIDGHRRDDGKWVKGPSYSPADLRRIIYGDLV